MGTITLQVPTSGLPNSTEDPKITSNFAALQTLLNGNLDAANINLGAALALACGRASGTTQSVDLGNYAINLGSTAHGTSTFLLNGMTYSTSTGFFTVPAAGVYAFTGIVNLALNGSAQTAAAYWQLTVLHNGSGSGGVAEGVPTTAVAPYAGLQVCDLVQCAIGDTLGLQVGGLGMSNTVPVNNYVATVARVT